MSNDDQYMGRFSEGAEVLGEDDPEKHRSGSFADEDLGATDTSADTRTTAIADLAYARFCRGFTEGRWDEFFDLVADEVDFAWPTAPGAGRFTGADGRRKMEERFRAFGGDRRMTEINVIARNVSGDTVFYEDDSHGVMAGAPSHGRHWTQRRHRTRGPNTPQDVALLRHRGFVLQSVRSIG
jgi:hypothetical protein